MLRTSASPELRRVYCVAVADRVDCWLVDDLRDTPKPFERRAYAWLRRALRARAQSGKNPAWCAAAPPPMSDWNLYAPTGTELAIVAVDVAADRVVPVHFLGWSMLVVNGLHASVSSEESKQDHSQQEIEASWQRIFEPALLAHIDETVVLAVDGILADEIAEITLVRVPREVACA